MFKKTFQTWHLRLSRHTLHSAKVTITMTGGFEKNETQRQCTRFILSKHSTVFLAWADVRLHTSHVDFWRRTASVSHVLHLRCRIQFPVIMVMIRGNGAYALRHGIQNPMEAILACHPAYRTGWQNGVKDDVFAQAPLISTRGK